MRSWRQKSPLVNTLVTEIKLSMKTEALVYEIGTWLGFSLKRKVFSLRNNCSTMIFTVSAEY